ncbi:MAG: hypothetical protein C0620_04370 [Desulfuromonas sp.]|nr:MAG: hypothetical protein C0620_04370 [Desulfuromonas sp.]
MLMFLSAPFCLLFFYLSWQLFRRKQYKHGILISLIAVFLLIVTVALGALGYFWATLDVPIN